MQLTISFKSLGGTLDWSNWVPTRSSVFVCSLVNGVPAMSVSSAYPGYAGGGGFQLNTTWEALGVPPGSTVNGVIEASLDGKCVQMVHGPIKNSPNTNQFDAATLVDGTTKALLSADRPYSAAETQFVTSHGQDLTGLSLASADEVVLTLSANMENGSSPHSTVTIEWDNLELTIEYV